MVEGSALRLSQRHDERRGGGKGRRRPHMIPDGPGRTDIQTAAPSALLALTEASLLLRGTLKAIVTRMVPMR